MSIFEVRYRLQAGDFKRACGTSRYGITCDLCIEKLISLNQKNCLSFKVLDKSRGQVKVVPEHDMKAYEEIKVQLHKL